MCQILESGSKPISLFLKTGLNTSKEFDCDFDKVINLIKAEHYLSDRKSGQSIVNGNPIIKMSAIFLVGFSFENAYWKKKSIEQEKTNIFAVVKSTVKLVLLLSCGRLIKSVRNYLNLAEKGLLNFPSCVFPSHLVS